MSRMSRGQLSSFQVHGLFWSVVWLGSVLQILHSQELVNDACDNCTFWKDGIKLYREGTCGKTCTTLDLSGKSIGVLHPEVFKGMDNLEEIFLSDNQLTEIGPQEFAELSSLRVLVLARNQIASFTLRSFFGLFNLETLDLSSNSICELPQPACNVPLWEECTNSCCELGLECYRREANYAQCRRPDDCPIGWECSGISRQVQASAVPIPPNCSAGELGTWGSCSSNDCKLPMWQQCYDGSSSCDCAPGMQCVHRDDFYGACLLAPYCPEGWQCTPRNSTSSSSECELELWNDCTQQTSGCCTDQLTCYSRDQVCAHLRRGQ